MIDEWERYVEGWRCPGDPTECAYESALGELEAKLWSLVDRDTEAPLFGYEWREAVSKLLPERVT